jgi:prepilin-type N-terminal cleavage/methylation domain-containing protein
MDVLRTGDEMKNQIANSKDQKKGFTLIEILVVITLMGVIGTITAQVFIIGTRSQAKSEILKEVKQNGDYIQTVVEGMVRNAVDIPDVSNSCNVGSDSPALTIINPDGNSTTFDCSDGQNVASNSSSLNLTLNSQKVRVSNCNFRLICPTPPTSPKYVFFTYTVCQYNAQACPALSGEFPENRASVEYQTTVTLRNYQ